MGDMSVAEVLTRAADLIEPEGAWTQNAMARASDGTQRGERASDAVCFCVGGAIIRSAHDDGLASNAIRLFRSVLCVFNLIDWNDARERTQPEVVAKLREAAAFASEQGL